jgi:hypothetical protein
MAKCLLEVAGHQAMTTAINLNLYVGLPTGIKGATHAIRKAIADPVQPELPEPLVPAPPVALLMQPPRGSQESQDDMEMDLLPKPGKPNLGNPYSTLLIDTMSSTSWAARRSFGQSGTGGLLVPGSHSTATGTAPSSSCTGRAALVTLC